MCTLFYLFIYYIYVCLQNVNLLANKTLQYDLESKIFILTVKQKKSIVSKYTDVVVTAGYKMREREREREREMFYLTTHSTHMVKDLSDSEKGNPLPPHRLLLSINSKGSFICTIQQTG